MRQRLIIIVHPWLFSVVGSCELFSVEWINFINFLLIFVAALVSKFIQHVNCIGTLCWDRTRRFSDNILADDDYHDISYRMKENIVAKRG